MDTSPSKVSVADIDALVSGATPHFAMQIRERLKVLLAGVPEGEVREYGELQLRVLDSIALGTTRGVVAVGAPPIDDESWRTLPSHPRGGIAPGSSSGGH